MTRAPAPPGPDRDPRDIVTERNFRVNPELLGVALAKPWRRGVSMLIDGLAIAVLANAPGVVFGFAAALVLWRASAKSVAGGMMRRVARRGSRIAATLIVFVMTVSLWNAWDERRADERTLAGVAAGETRVVLSGAESVTAAADLLSFTRSRDEVEALRRADRVVLRLQAAGVEDAEIREVLRGLSRSSTGRPWLATAAESIGARLDAHVGPTDAERRDRLSEPEQAGRLSRRDRRG